MGFDPVQFAKENAEKYKEVFESVTLENEEVPEGEYRVKVESAISKLSKAGNEMVEWKLRVLDGKYKNRVIWKHHRLDGDDNIKRFGKDLLRVGVPELKWFEFKNDLEKLLDAEFKIEVKVNVQGENKYRNVYFVKKLSSFESIMAEEVPF